MSDRIKYEIAQSGLSPFELSKKSKVNYFAINRIKNHGVKNVTENVRLICSFLNISIDKYANTGTSKQDIFNALDEIWDGTPAQADFLINLIKSAEGFLIKVR